MYVKIYVNIYIYIYSKPSAGNKFSIYAIQQGYVLLKVGKNRRNAKYYYSIKVDKWCVFR